jgi:adenylate cyclase
MLARLPPCDIADLMVDFAAEGLLDGLQGDARDARERLLRHLHDDGVPLDELRAAVADNTLLMLPVERRVGAEPRWTFDEIAAESGVDPEFLADLRRTAGLPVEGGEVRVFTDADLDAALTARRYLDAGVPPDDMLEVVRILGRSLAQAAEAMRRASLAAVFDPDADEYELAMRYADNAEALQPLTAPMLDQLLQLHLRHAVRSELLEVAERESGGLPGAREVAVCFADLVGFTRVGEEVDPAALGAIAERLETLAAQIATGPVRLVKTIGDAVLLVSPDVDALIEATLDLIDAAEAEDADFPQLRAGMARGPALHRAGDWYGRPVNLAARLTAIARAGSLLCDQAVHDAAQREWRWSFAGERRVRNVRDPVKVHRVRRPRPATSEAD